MGNHYSERASKKPIPRCPKCGGKAFETETKYGLRNKHCGLWSWDRYPLADAKTHSARSEAHKVFDALWRNGGPLKGRRSAAYAMLADEMNLTSEQCHMKLMDADTARRVPAAVQAIRDRLEAAK